VLPDVLRSDAAILPRPLRVDQSAERHSRVGIDDPFRAAAKAPQ